MFLQSTRAEQLPVLKLAAFPASRVNMCRAVNSQQSDLHCNLCPLSVAIGCEAIKIATSSFDKYLPPLQTSGSIFGMQMGVL